MIVDSIHKKNKRVRERANLSTGRMDGKMVMRRMVGMDRRQTRFGKWKFF